MSFETIVKNIDSLPLLSDIFFKIQKLYEDGSDNIKIPELISLIESDAILSVNILKMANSPIYGFSKKISTISQAVTLFGIMQIRSFVMSYAIKSNIEANMDVYGITNEKFNDMCSLQSALVLQWYSKINLSVVNQVAPLALIMESGKLILANEIANSDYVDEFKIGLKKANNIKEYEESLLDINSYTISALLFKHWHLDPIYVDILENKIEGYLNILYVVKTAINVREILTKNSVLNACKMVKVLGLDVDWFVKSCLRVKKSYMKEL